MSISLLSLRKSRFHVSYQSQLTLLSLGSYGRSLWGVGVLSSGLRLGGESGVSRALRGEFRLLSWSSSWSWSRLFRGVRSGVKKGIVIQEFERPPLKF